MAGDGSGTCHRWLRDPHALPRTLQVGLQPGCCAAHLELQILQKSETGSRSAPFIRPVVGSELCDEC